MTDSHALVVLPSPALVASGAVAPDRRDNLPVLAAAWAGERAGQRSFEFLAANIRNPNTRKAYHHATLRFVRWCAARGLALAQLRGVHIARYVDELGSTHAPLTVKQHLAAIKHWLDYLVTGRVIEQNRARAALQPGDREDAGARSRAGTRVVRADR